MLTAPYSFSMTAIFISLWRRRDGGVWGVRAEVDTALEIATAATRVTAVVIVAIVAT